MNVHGAGFPHPDHDHGRCVDSGLRAAETVCTRHGRKLTSDRRQILEIVLRAPSALGAYDIVERMDWQGRKRASSVVYRSLNFLTELGLVHKLHTRNAYIACVHPGEAHGTQFLICRQCDAIAEVASKSVDRALSSAAHQVGFTLQNPVVEAAGLCPHCAGA